MTGIKINEIKTLLAEDGFRETDITYPFSVWVDTLIVFLPLRVLPSGKHNNNNKLKVLKNLNVNNSFAQSEH